MRALDAPLSFPPLSAKIGDMHELAIVDAVLDQVCEEVRNCARSGA